MSGRGQRFRDAGYSTPKQLVEVKGIPIIELVIKNLHLPGTYVFVCLKEHLQNYPLEKILRRIVPDCKIVKIDKVTGGAAETVLYAKEFINNSDELIIADSDGWVDWDTKHFFNFLKSENPDGVVVTFKSNEPRWSFAKTNDKGLVTRIAEKRPISNNAICGIYYFKNGKSFVDTAEKIVSNNIKEQNEFYVAPIYNQFINKNKKILCYPVNKMVSLGTPADLKDYVRIHAKDNL